MVPEVDHYLPQRKSWAGWPYHFGSCLTWSCSPLAANVSRLAHTFWLVVGGHILFNFSVNLQPRKRTCQIPLPYASRPRPTLVETLASQ
ncbi:hypothetical protein EMPG_16640 [Blastomyces silverae]|uniref:Uncharacterized protein n=1 Tax=Blastomyces silverae TaxID=2060906 RepID=A0A0H1BA63_9EURO|nr:hypothetical protein EMPG_16640 [Blastomyces silverae]